MIRRIYDFRRLISEEGGQADVHEVSLRDSEETFAAKIPKEMTAHLPEVQQRFLREAGHYQRLHAFQRHPHVVRMVEIIQVNGRQGIVLELMEASFASRLKNGISDTEKVQAIRHAAFGLDHLHRNGIVHRDMKPSNLLRSKDGRYAVSDLGCATAAGATGFNLTKASIGTPGLMAPEQHAPHYYADARSDMYGLGTCIAAAFLGQFPEQKETDGGKSIEVTLGEKMGDLDRDFQLLIWKCIDPNAGNRFASMHEFTQEWDKLARRGVLKTPRSFTQKLVQGVAAVGLFALFVSVIAKIVK